MNEPLTPQQIDNWRTMLLGMIGPYALIMPAEHIQQYRDKLQARANKLATEGTHD